MAFIDFAYLVDRFGAVEIKQLFNDRVTITAADVQAKADADPSNPPSDPAAATRLKGIVDGFIEDGQSEANGYLSGRFSTTLPFTDATAPRSLRIKLAHIVRYYMYENSPTSVVRENYQLAIQWFRDVASGRVQIGLDTSGEIMEPDKRADFRPITDFELELDEDRRVFTDESLGRFLDPT